MRRSDLLAGAALGASASMITAPLIEIAIAGVFGNVRAPQVLGGALCATLFFAISALAGAAFLHTPYFGAAILGSYVAKIFLLFVVVKSLSMNSSDAKVFGLSIGISAAAYLAFQTIYLARWRRMRWIRRTS